MGQSLPTSQASARNQQCGCSVFGPLSVLAADCRGDEPAERRNIEEIGVSTDGCESESASSEANSEGSDRAPSFALSRPRVFLPHVRAKFHDHYRIEKLLGEGSYGNVFQVEANSAADLVSGALHCSDGAGAVIEQPRRVAAKCFAIAASPKPREGETPCMAAARNAKEIAARRASFEKERAILARLEHPHIIKMFEAFEGVEQLWIVMELCRGGELYESIAERVRCGSGAGIEEPTAKVLYRQMVHAMSYLQSCCIVHRDVKTENFLLVGQAGSVESECVKLCDFGTGVSLTEESPRAMERIGTLSYTAPEIYAKLGCNTLADTWSLGVVLYVLLVGASPFRITGEEPRHETIDRIAHGRYDQERLAWRGLSDLSRDLVRRFLVVNEQGRVRYCEALRHPWLRTAAAPRLSGKGAPPQTPRLYMSPNAKNEGSFMDLAPIAVAALATLQKFANLDPLQQLMLLVCTQMTPDAELSRFHSLKLPWYDLFFALDSNEDGRLDLNEFVQGMKVLLGAASGSSQEEKLVKLSQSLDLDRSGAIEWAEWAAVPMVESERFALLAEPMSTTFRVLDRPSGDGAVGVADLLAVTTNGVEDEVSKESRDLVYQLLTRWRSLAGTGVALALPALGPSRLSAPSPVRRRKRSQNGQVAPALTVSELRRVLASVTLGVDEWQLDAWSQGTGWFGCCQTDGPVQLQRHLTKVAAMEHYSARSKGER